MSDQRRERNKLNKQNNNTINFINTNNNNNIIHNNNSNSNSISLFNSNNDDLNRYSLKEGKDLMTPACSSFEKNSNNNSDLDGDLIPDTVVYDAEGKPMVWNGYHYVRNAPMLEREVFMQNPENEEKYGYSIKKYKFDQKSPFEQMLHNIAKTYYDQIKAGIPDAPEKKIVLSDLSINFIKTFIKQAIMIPYLIDVGLIQGIQIGGYIAVLKTLAENKDADPDFKYGKAVNLMALFTPLPSTM